VFSWNRSAFDLQGHDAKRLSTPTRPKPRAK